MAKSAMDKVLDEIVVFKNGATGEYFSNNPVWHNETVRQAWHDRFADEDSSDGVEADSDDEDEVEDYSEMTNEALRAELSTRGLDVTGKKSELIKRLEEDDAQAEKEEE
jgi:hypothetical protein